MTYKVGGLLHLDTGELVRLPSPSPQGSLVYEGLARDPNGAAYIAYAPQTINSRVGGLAFTADGALIATPDLPGARDDQNVGPYKIRSDGAVYIVDVSSATDTFINGIRISNRGQLVTSVRLPGSGTVSSELSVLSLTYEWSGGMVPDGLGNVLIFQTSSTVGQPDGILNDSFLTMRSYSIAGNSWGALSTVYTPVAGKSAPYVQPFIVGSKIRLYFQEQTSGDVTSSICKYIESTDLTGTSWGAATTWFTPTQDGRDSYFYMRIRVAPNGDWVSTHLQEGSFDGGLYQRQNIILRSTDAGVTWNNDTNCDVMWKGQAVGVIIEIDTCAIDTNNWVALGRKDSTDKLQFFRSADGGHTWSAPVSSTLGFSNGGDQPNPIIIKTYKDDLRVIWENRNPNARHMTSSPTPPQYALQNIWATQSFIGSSSGLGNQMACRIDDALKKTLVVFTKEETTTTSKLLWFVLTDV